MVVVTRTGRAAASSILLVVLILAACSEAKIVENTAAACSNREDDDGDGKIDCDDLDCFATDACERNAATCSNGVDDDGNGSIDCQQESCRSLPSCKDPVETPCVIAATETGCPRGKGCYITADNRRWCALEGPSLAGGPCGDTDPSDRSQGCASGYLCVANRCAKVCAHDYKCTRNSICRPLGPVVSVCTLSCASQTDCHDDEDCVALQRTGLALEQGGWAHQCVARRVAPAPGTAAAGDLCFEDNLLNRAPSEICAPGLLCVPEPGGGRCRAVCRARADGAPSNTCASGLCYAVLPFSAQESRFDEPDVVGVCL